MKNTQKIMIDTENQMVDYILTRKNVKNINMHIDADGKVRVSANSKIGIDEINHFVMEHTGFINKAVSNNAKRKTLYPDKKLNIGMAAETSDIYTILGKQYFLKIIETNKEEVCLDEKEKNIVLYTRNAQIVRHNDMLIMDFLKKKAENVFMPAVCRAAEAFKYRGVAKPKVVIKDLVSKWGSCKYNEGLITLNLKLLAAPQKCVEYVIIHEFAHFIRHDHSKFFYGVIGEYMPDYRDCIEELKNYR